MSRNMSERGADYWTPVELRVLELRIAGRTFEEIAREISYAGPGPAHGVYVRALEKGARLLGEPSEGLRAQEIQRRISWLATLQAQIDAGDVDRIDKALRVADSLAKLYGLDQLVKIALTDPSGEREYGGLDLNKLGERADALLELARTRRAEGDPAGDDLDTPPEE